MSPKSADTKPKAKQSPETKASPKKKESKEKFFRVIFNHRQTTNETVDVQLAVNGEQLVAKRGEEVIIPARYKEVADNATYQTFTQLPGVDRKVTGTVQVYPYQLQGEASEKEFKDFLAAGNKMAKDAHELKQAQAGA